MRPEEIPACRLLYLDFRFERLTRRLESGCLEWLGAKSVGGGRTGTPYGTFNPYPIHRPVRAHVWAAWREGIIEDLRVPRGQHLDHDCDYTLCVEGTCLRLVPFEENIAKMWENRRERQRRRLEKYLSGVPF